MSSPLGFLATPWVGELRRLKFAVKFADLHSQEESLID